MIKRNTVSSITKAFTKMAAQLDALVEKKLRENNRLADKSLTIQAKIDGNVSEIEQARKVKARIEDLVA